MATKESLMLIDWLRNLTVRSYRKRVQRRNVWSMAELLEVRELPTVLYVAMTGNDSAPGTEDAPYRTLARALDEAGAGDTVVLRNGTYDGGVDVDDPNVTIRSYENEWAHITAPIDDDDISSVIRFSETADGGK